MTYTLRMPGVEADEPSWAARRDRVASLIRFHVPDVLGVQGAVPRMLDDLDAGLDGDAWTGPSGQLRLGRRLPPHRHLGVLEDDPQEEVVNRIVQLLQAGRW